MLMSRIITKRTLRREKVKESTEENNLHSRKLDIISWELIIQILKQVNHTLFFYVSFLKNSELQH